MLYSDQNCDTFQIDAMAPHSEMAPYTISICSGVCVCVREIE